MAKNTKNSVQSVNWEELLQGMNTGGGGNFFFPKPGRTVVRIVPLEKGEFHPGSETGWLGETVDPKWNKKKYILMAQVLKTDQGPLGDRWAGRVVPVILPATVIKGIFAILSEDFDLLSDDGGLPITIRKEGKGLNTTYNVMPAAQAHAIDREELEIPETTLSTLSEEFKQNQLDRMEAGTGATSKDTEESSGESW